MAVIHASYSRVSLVPQPVQGYFQVHPHPPVPGTGSLIPPGVIALPWINVGFIAGPRGRTRARGFVPRRLISTSCGLTMRPLSQAWPLEGLSPASPCLSGACYSPEQRPAGLAPTAHLRPGITGGVTDFRRSPIPNRCFLAHPGKGNQPHQGFTNATRWPCPHGDEMSAPDRGTSLRSGSWRHGGVRWYRPKFLRYH